MKILRIAVLMCDILVRSIMQNEERRGHGIMGEQLTRSDVQKIKEEIEYRKLVVRKKELEAVKEARAQGDLSENFEYKAAKQDKNRNESRIRYLERMIRTAVQESYRMYRRTTK